MNQLKLQLDYQQLDEWPEGYNSMLELFWSDIEGESLGFDIETEGLSPYNKEESVLSISISGENQSYALHKDQFKQGLHLVQKILESRDCMIIGHNIKFDINYLHIKYGWRINCLVYDTMLAQYFLNENDRFISLEELTDRYKIMNSYKKKVIGNRIYEMNKSDLLLYNMKDARSCVILKPKLDLLLETDGLTGIMNVACQAIPVLSRMETRGILVDMVYAKQQQMKLYKELLDFKLSLKRISNTTFNVDSPKQLSGILYNRFDFTPIRWTNTGAPSTDYETIIRLRQEQCLDRCESDVEFIDTLIKYNKLSTLSEKYYNKLRTWIKPDGCVHTNYSLGATTTGRLTSSSPNMQSQKRGSEFRGVYVPKPGYIFCEGDWSQIELRIAAWLAREKRMLQMFDDGLDIHTATLCQMKGYNYEDTLELLDTPTHPEYLETKNLRVGIKNINFGELYGATPYRLQREMVKNGIYWDIEECDNLCKERRRMYPDITRWKRNIEKFIVANKYAVMPFGQIRRLPFADWNTPEGREAIRQGVNFIVQSTASGWMPIIGMILLDNYFYENKIDGHILLNVHDSILSEIKIYSEKKMKKIKDDIVKIMEHTIKDFINEVFKLSLNVPLEFKCEYMERWR